MGLAEAILGLAGRIEEEANSRLLLGRGFLTDFALMNGWANEIKIAVQVCVEFGNDISAKSEKEFHREMIEKAKREEFRNKPKSTQVIVPDDFEDMMPIQLIGINLGDSMSTVVSIKSDTPVGKVFSFYGRNFEFRNGKLHLMGV